MDIDLERFFRNVRLKVHFARDIDGNEVDNQITSDVLSLDVLGLRLHSTYTPPRNSHPVETFVHLVKQDVEHLTKSIYKGEFFENNNMTKEEHIELQSLLDDETIIIKPADKPADNCGNGLLLLRQRN